MSVELPSESPTRAIPPKAWAVILAVVACLLAIAHLYAHPAPGTEPEISPETPQAEPEPAAEPATPPEGNEPSLEPTEPLEPEPELVEE